MNNLPESIYDYRYEREEATIVDHCNECDRDIYEGEEYYTFGTYNVCDDCIDTYVRQAKVEVL